MDDERSAVAIRQIIQRWREKTDTEPGWRDWLADEAEAAIATLLKRDEEQETQIAVMREALGDLPLLALEHDWPCEVEAARAALAPDTGNLRVMTVDQLEQLADNLDGFDPPWLSELIGEK